jgi:hypothetical protein
LRISRQPPPTHHEKPRLASAQTPEAKVSVAGPTTPYLPNAVNEPALAIDANHPTVLAAGANAWSTAPPATAVAAT